MSSEETQWEAWQQPHFHECTLVRIPQHLVQPFYTTGLGYQQRKPGRSASEWRGTEPQNKPSAVLTSGFGLRPASSATARAGADCHMGERAVLFTECIFGETVAQR